MIPRIILTSLSALVVLVLAGCGASASPTAEAPATDTSAGHGTIAGAEEVAEPQLSLVAVDASGASSMLDLLDGEVTPLEPLTNPARVTTDGRYVFAASERGVEILDSGVWTWDHVDHFHFYRAETRTVGELPGSGIAEVSSGLLSTAGSTGVFFPGSGDAVLLDNGALSGGDIVETLRVDTGAADGLIVPLGDRALVAQAGSGSRAEELRVFGPDGAEGEAIPCTQPAGTITTRVGVVVGCADGAVLAVESDEGSISLEQVEYPANAGAPATSFSARKGRPTVAGLGADSGIWLLDTRAREWQWIPSETPIIAAAAVDDEAGHVVALRADGVVEVRIAGSGQLLAVTEPLLDATLAEAQGDAEMLDHVTLTVDAQRAYLNAPAEGIVYEIDYADAARVARTLEVGVRPAHLVEVGR